MKLRSPRRSPKAHISSGVACEEQREQEPNKRRRSNGNEWPLNEELELCLDTTVTIATNVHIPGSQLDGEAKELEKVVDLCRHLHEVDLWDQCGYLERVSKQAS